MPAPALVPESLLSAPFTVAMAREAGLSTKSLRGRRFVQLLRGVHAHIDHPMTHADWIRAARLAVPDRAQLSHLTRLQAMGLDLHPHRPFHFTVTGDLHLAIRDVFLHRTPRLPAIDDVGVTPTSAFIGICSWERLIDVVKAGDWLLHHGHMTVAGLVELARNDDWRAGSAEALAVVPSLDGRSRSVRESEVRMMMVGSGLPRPETNRPVVDDPRSPISDLWLPQWRVSIEYEGGQHFTDRGQGLRDISRYATMRDADIAYVQVVDEMMRQPRALMHHIHATLARRGYAGPAPFFGEAWDRLSTPLRARPGRQRPPRRAVG
jgi:hypothetical protein